MGKPFNSTTRLGQLLLEQGWSLHEFSVVSGVNARYLSSFLAGHDIPVKYLEPIADGLDMSVDDLLYGDD